MSFLSALGKIGGLIGGVAGIPFTGGASLAATLPSILGGVGNVASVLGAQQGGKAKGAADTAGITQGQDRNAIALFQAKQAAENEAAQRDLQRQKFGADEQGRNAKNAILSALLGGGMPRTAIDVPGIQSAKVSGGLMDALKNNPDALAALSTLKGQAGQSLESGPSFTGGNAVAAPTLTPLPNTGGSNSFLNALTSIGQIAGAGVSSLPAKKKPVPGVQTDDGVRY